MTQLCFTQCWCQRQRDPWRLWCTWQVWAGPRSTRETHNVSFVWNDCSVGTGLPLSSCCLLSAVKCGNDFCLWDRVQIYLGGMGFSLYLYLSSSLSRSPFHHFSVRALIRFCDFAKREGEFAMKEWREWWSEEWMRAGSGLKGIMFKRVGRGGEMKDWDFLHTHI